MVSEQLLDYLVGWLRPDLDTRFVLLFSSRTTACAIAACSVPMPSGVLALIPMSSPGIPSRLDKLLRIAATCGPSFGWARIMVESTLTTAYPTALTRLNASVKKSAESAPFHRGSEGEKRVPISGAAMAPSKASVMACSKASPSECPPNPLGCGISTPPIFSGTPLLNSCESQPYPIRIRDCAVVLGLMQVFYSGMASRTISTTDESAFPGQTRVGTQVMLVGSF